MKKTHELLTQNDANVFTKLNCWKKSDATDFSQLNYEKFTVKNMETSEKVLVPRGRIICPQLIRASSNRYHELQGQISR